MLVSLISWMVVATAAMPGAPDDADSVGLLFHQPLREAVISAAFARDLAAEPDASFRVWVFFTDKGLFAPAELDAALNARRAVLAPRALQRRALRRTAPGLLDPRDLPPARQYVAQVLATGARLRQTSNWLNAISVEAGSAQIRAIGELPFVRGIRRLARSAPRPPLPEEPADPADAPSHASPRGDPVWYGPSYDQLNQINVVAAHDAGYTGSGVIVGILDTGFSRTHVAFNQTTPAHPVQILGEYDFVNDDGNTAPEPGDDPSQHAHGTYILGTLGAYYPGFLVGSAYDASFLLAKTEDITQEVPVEEDQYVAGLEWIEANGADLATSSLGYIDWYTQADLDGQTAVTTLAVNVATANGLVCCTAAGNESHDGNPAIAHLIAPADAFEVLTCGAVYSFGDIAEFSSDGPTADGRVKPEVLARGVDTATVTAMSDGGVTYPDGTSLSTPLVAGAVALILQAHPDWTVDKVRRALFHTASDFLANAAYDPLYVRGYGIINAFAAIQFVHSDVNGDGVADGRDIRPFVEAMLGVNPDPDETRRADINADGDVNINDAPILINDMIGS